MKSIIEQASSIMKAIEKAWDQAGKPKEFSIKIFEQEERNFFGMTTKPAKVGIFFGDKPIIHEKTVTKPRAEIKECRSETRESKLKTNANSQPIKNNVSTQQSKLIPRAEHVVRTTVSSIQATFKQSTEKIVKDNTKNKALRIPATWNDTMISTTQHWLQQTLSLMGMSSIEFNSEIAGKNLKLTFNKPLITDPMHEKQLFRSFAHLIMSSLRNQYKQEIKDLKVILIRPE